MSVLFTPFRLDAQSLSFNVTTKTYNGQYAPKHCFALWITDASGNYVKTINRQSKNYTRYLTNWVSGSGSKTTDGMTGASLTSHNYAYTSSSKTTQRIPFTWDFLDYNGTLVDDGTYYINIEFTESNATGKTVKYAFTKGISSYSGSLTPVSSSSYFSNATIAYTAPATSLEKTETSGFKAICTRSDRTLHLSYDPALHYAVRLQLFNLKGQSVYQTMLDSPDYQICLSMLTNGIYFVKFIDEEGLCAIEKIVL